MVRALVLSILAVAATGATGCDSRSGPPQVAPGTAVAKVLEVQGKVTATRDGKVRPLAAGDALSPDDLVETAADGSVRVELFHNRAKLALTRGASTRIDRSLAWELTPSEVAAMPEGQVTVAAGQVGERSAADTKNTIAPGAALDRAGTTGAGAGEPAPPATSPPVEPTAAPIIEAPPRPTEVPERKRPPSRKRSMEEAKDQDDDGIVGAAASDRGGAGDRAAEPSQAPLAPPPAPIAQAPTLQQRLDAQRARFQRCLTSPSERLTIQVKVAAGAPTFTIAGDTRPETRACVQAAIRDADLTSFDGTATLTLTP